MITQCRQVRGWRKESARRRGKVPRTGLPTVVDILAAPLGRSAPAKSHRSRTMQKSFETPKGSRGIENFFDGPSGARFPAGTGSAHALRPEVAKGKENQGIEK